MESPATTTILSPILGRPTEVRPSRYSREPWQLVECQETGFVFLRNPPAYAALEDDLAWERQKKAERRRRTKQEPLFAPLSLMLRGLRKLTLRKRPRNVIARMLRWAGRLKRSSLTLVDVGCGDGGILLGVHELLKERGVAVVPHGIEISRGLADLARQTLEPIGGKVHFGPAIEQLAGVSDADAVILWSVLEHEQRPRELLLAIRRVLAPGGLVLIKVPNYACWLRRLRGRRWCGFRLPDHVNYFTPRTLAILAQETGFRVARCNWIDREPLNDSMYMVMEKGEGAG